jgi:urease accessory protein
MPAGGAMILNCKMAQLDRNPLHGAGLASAALQSSIPDAPISSDSTSDRHLERAEGLGRIVLGRLAQRTRIIDVFQKSPVRIMLPKEPGGNIEEAVLINTGGGIAGGDRLEYEITVLQNASIAVSSQAAEKLYRALDEPARIRTKLKVIEGAKLAWLPQETIVFNAARICRNTEIEVSSGSELLALEWIVLGRAAYGEEMTGGHIAENWRAKRDGKLIWADNFRVTDEVFEHLQRKALLSECKAIGTLIYFGPHLDKRLEFWRTIVPSRLCYCAVTAVNGLIVTRVATTSSSDLRIALLGLLQQLNREFGSGPFRVPKMWSC